MKQLFCQLLIILTVIFSHDYCTGQTLPLKWGYLVHSDSLSPQYLRSIKDRYSVISVTGFVLHEDGTVSTPAGPAWNILKDLPAKSTTSIYPLISFRSPAAGRRILSSEMTRREAARRIASLAGKNGFRGIHLDFEYLPPEDAPRLGMFLDDLRRCYKGIITMAIFPQVDFPEKWRAFHDLSIIAPRVDHIVIMCYDLHGPHTGPGPVTDIRWAEKNIRYTLSYCDSRKVWLGIPAYGYRWCGKRAYAVSSKQGTRLAAAHGARRDPSGNLSYYTGSSCVTYLSDHHTRSLLEALARRFNLAGTALWRIGFEE